MSHAYDVPLWAALLTALLVLIGAGLTLAGAIGTLRLGSFYERVHAPTLGTSWGTGAIAMASAIFFSVLGTRVVVYEVLIAIFITVTTPVTLMLLARAALYRDRTEGRAGVPSKADVRREAGLSQALVDGGID